MERSIDWLRVVWADAGGMPLEDSARARHCSKNGSFGFNGSFGAQPPSQTTARQTDNGTSANFLKLRDAVMVNPP